MPSQGSGFITILIGLYSYQDCLHFMASVRRFHQEPIVIVIDQVPWFLKLILQSFKNVSFVQAPRNKNPVLASRLAKVNLYNLSPFEKTIYLDSDICLLSPIPELFSALDAHDLLMTHDMKPKLREATNLLRGKQLDGDYGVTAALNQADIPCTDATDHYNSGLAGFRKSDVMQTLFSKYQDYLYKVLDNQDVFRLRDQGALAAAIEFSKPHLKQLPASYNFMSQWKNTYGELDSPVKVLHCTYPIRPQYAKDVTRSLMTRIFDRLARFFLPTQLNNDWRESKGEF